jgi:F-type H+-transporting ATPase subunit b
MFTLLEINPLILPDVGLVFWSSIAFFILLFVLTKFAWKPIMKAVTDRENSITTSLATAERVKAEMAQLKNENEALMMKAREERAVMIKEAKETADKMIAEAKEKAKLEANRIVSDASASIQQQKMAALTDVKNQVGNLVIEVAEKVLRRELDNKAAQENYIKALAGDIKLN